MFYLRINTGTSLGAYELNHEWASEKVPIFYSAIKHGYKCFIWNSNTARPIVALLVMCWTGLFGKIILTYHLDRQNVKLSAQT